MTLPYDKLWGLHGHAETDDEQEQPMTETTPTDDETDHDQSDRAPTVYDADGTPLKVRIVGAECEGDVSGEGHYGYRKQTAEADQPTVYFERA